MAAAPSLRVDAGSSGLNARDQQACGVRNAQGKNFLHGH
jgi:hypothetical protein